MTIKEARLKAGLTQQAMSEMFKIPKRTIENWEAGKRTPPAYVESLIIEKLEGVSKMKKTYYTANYNGDIGCHDCDIERAKQNLEIMQEQFPDDEWELFDSEDKSE